MKPYDKIHAKNQRKYIEKIRQSYLNCVKEISKLGKNLQSPTVQKKINKLIDELYFNVNGVTIEGVNSEWDLAVEKNNDIAKTYFGKDWKDLPNDLKNKYLSTNDKARQSFVERKINGLGISDRVWRNTKQFRQELELAVEYGIGKGYSASRIALNIQKYLNEPSKLFRRVRDKNGKLQLSKAAKDYHPGQGVYRSSYKNAMRLAVNETNLSYENSNYKKRQQQDFVVGQEIKVSPQHKPSDDKGGIVCVHLQGFYPKEFDFTYRWHVKCKCSCQSVLKTKAELSQDMDLIMDGKPPKTPSVNQVNGLPDNYVNYIKRNEKKWENWATKPKTFTNANNSITKLGTQTPISAISRNPFDVDVRKKLENLSENEFENELFIFGRLNGLSFDEISTIAYAPDKIDKFLDLMAKNSKQGDYFVMNKFQYEEVAGRIKNLSVDERSQLYYSAEGYIGTSNYRKINNHLRFGDPLDLRSKDSIRILDGLIDSNTLPENTMLFRNADEGFLEKISGEWRMYLNNELDLDNFVNAINKKIDKGFVYSDEGFTSTSCIESANVFQSRVCSIKIKAPKGTNAYTTTNYDESEIILKRNQKFRVISVKKSIRTYKSGWGSKTDTMNIIEIEVVAI